MKVLKRKDASSLVVGVALGLIIYNFASSFTQAIADGISSVNRIGLTWRDNYLQPIVWFILQLIVLEILVWVFCWISTQMKNKPQA